MQKRLAGQKDLTVVDSIVPICKPLVYRSVGEGEACVP